MKLQPSCNEDKVYDVRMNTISQMWINLSNVTKDIITASFSSFCKYQKKHFEVPILLLLLSDF